MLEEKEEEKKYLYLRVTRANGVSDCDARRDLTVYLNSHGLLEIDCTGCQALFKPTIAYNRFKALVLGYAREREWEVICFQCEDPGMGLFNTYANPDYRGHAIDRETAVGLSDERLE